MPSRSPASPSATCRPRLAFFLIAAIVLELAGSSARALAQGFDFGPRVPIRTDAATESDDDSMVEVATSRHGTWIAVWAKQTPLSGDSDILLTRSVDQGLTWSPPQQLDGDADTHALYSFIPSLATDGNGTWIVVWTVAGLSPSAVFFVRSTDDGVTWTAPTAFDAGSLAPRGSRVVTDRHGVWIAGWWHATNLTQDTITIVRSTDAGLTWSAVPLVAAPPAGRFDVDVDFASDEKGNWLATWAFSVLPVLGANIVAARSTDGGLTWTEPEIVGNVTNTHLEDNTPHVAGDGNGVWMVVWSRGTAGNDRAIISRSLDGGQTWTDAQSLNPNDMPGDLILDSHPVIVTNHEGVWLAVWNSRDPLGGLNPVGYDNVVISRSTNQGATWSPLASVGDAFAIGPCDNRGDQDGSIAIDSHGDLVAVWGRYFNFCPDPPVQPDTDIFTTRLVTSCGNGVVEGAEECDDGNTDDGDGCASNCRLTVCPPAPRLDCREAGATSSLTVRNTTRRELEWDWMRGPVASSDLGDPTHTSDDYLLCAYDQQALVTARRASGGASCNGKPCWTPKGSGFEYRERTRRSESALLMQLRPSERGRAHLRVRVRGPGIEIPALPVHGPVTVQLQRPGMSTCWGSTFSEPYLRNEGTGFAGHVP